MKIIQMTKQAFSNEPLPYKLRGAASEIEQSDITSPGYVALFREAANSIADQAAEIQRLRGLLEKAVEVIKGWHNLEHYKILDDKELEAMWKIYWEKSPEMKDIRAELKKEPS